MRIVVTSDEEDHPMLVMMRYKFGHGPATGVTSVNNAYAWLDTL